ncbi:MAG: OmpA family protein [Treponema sp.]|nr:OmpA family protein [Treponema sp.]
MDKNKIEKKEPRFTKVDLLIIFFCFAGACISGIVFWGAYNNTLEKINEEPVGTIVFQKRVAQRKFADRNIWDRLRLSSLVYNGDTIRTVEQSEAIVTFGDEATHLTLGESTMIQIFFDNRSGAQIDFSGGNIDVASENTNIVITSGTSTIVLDGQARMERSDEGFVLSVLEGQVNFDGTEMETGSILALDADGEISTNPIMTMTSFGSSAYVLGTLVNTPRGTTPVVFSWNYFYFTPDTYVIIEISTDRRFNNIIETREINVSHGDGSSTISIPLGNGYYWWRAFPAETGSRQPINRFFPTGALEVIPVSPAALYTPQHSADLAFSGESQIPFSWSAVENASSYLIEISANADMSRPVVSRRVESNSVTHTGLARGNWHWRITPVFPSHIKGSALPSTIGIFSVRDDKSPPVIPQLPPIIFGADNFGWDDLDIETAINNDRILSRVVQFLNANRDIRVRVEGHVNPTGNIDTDMLLSQNRARTIVALLVELGVDSRQLEYRGLGGQHPIAREDINNLWRNRRVEFVFLE